MMIKASFIIQNTQFVVLLLKNVDSFGLALIALLHDETEIAASLLHHAGPREYQPHPPLIVVIRRVLKVHLRLLSQRNPQ